MSTSSRKELCAREGLSVQIARTVRCVSVPADCFIDHQGFAYWGRRTILISNSGFDVEAYAMIGGELGLSGSTRYLGLTAVVVDVLT